MSLIVSLAHLETVPWGSSDDAMTAVVASGLAEQVPLLVVAASLVLLVVVLSDTSDIAVAFESLGCDGVDDAPPSSRLWPSKLFNMAFRDESVKPPCSATPLR